MHRKGWALGSLAAAAFATGCGGKVIFDEPGSGGAGGGLATSASTTGHASTGTQGACLTAVTVGTGDFGPSPAFGTKCFAWSSGPCPSLYAANAYINVDPCYALASVDSACTSPKPNVCCYNITEKITCKQN